MSLWMCRRLYGLIWGVLIWRILISIRFGQPGGLSWRTLIHVLGAVARERHVVGFDMTELSPIPGLVAPDLLAARLAYKLIGYVFHARRQLS